VVTELTWNYTTCFNQRTTWQYLPNDTHYFTNSTICCMLCNHDKIQT